MLERREGINVPDVGVLLAHADHHTLLTRRPTIELSKLSVYMFIGETWETTHGKTARGASSPTVVQLCRLIAVPRDVPATARKMRHQASTTLSTLTSSLAHSRSIVNNLK